MSYIFLASGWLLSLILGVIIVPKILFISHKKHLYDLPDIRKMHNMPIPRLGGLSFFPVILISVCFVLGVRYFFGYPIENLPPEELLCEFLFFAVGSMILYLVGAADDLVGVGYRHKFISQINAALLLVWGGEWINSLGGLFGIYMLPVYIGIPITLFIVVFITNAINLLDGIDGLASGLCCCVLVILGWMCFVQGEYIFALLAFATFGVVIPFWVYNVFGNANRGQKLFMGDTGSLILGYIISFLVIHLSNFGMPDGAVGRNINLLLAFSTLIVPLFDVVRVVLHRLRHKKNPFLPDKNHIHHKLIRTGLRIRQVMIYILLLALSFIVLNRVMIEYMNITIVLLIDIAIWVAMHLAINKYIKTKESKKILRQTV